jgi:hypothetical protein
LILVASGGFDSYKIDYTNWAEAVVAVWSKLASVAFADLQVLASSIDGRQWSRLKLSETVPTTRITSSPWFHR